MIHGESGVGKEIVARALHANAPWKDGPFVPINCGALPAGLVESELFGHERGAFSGAAETKVGLFEAAVGGTLFLDEVGELPLELQARLLRFLDDYRVRRVGAVSARAVEIRVVSATNRDLRSFVEEQRFRNDLYHRIGGAILDVPPLRARRADILRLADAFLASARALSSSAPARLSDAAALALLRHRWPGNVRELKHAMEYVAATMDGVDVDVGHLPAFVLAEARTVASTASSPRLPAGPQATDETKTTRVIPIKDQVDEFVRGRMLDALQAVGGNVARAARLLRSKASRYPVLRRPPEAVVLVRAFRSGQGAVAAAAA